MVKELYKQCELRQVMVEIMPVIRSVKRHAPFFDISSPGVVAILDFRGLA